MDFAVPADHRVKLKANEKKNKCQDLARELKKLWNMKVWMILIVIGALCIVTKGLVQGLEDLEIRGRVLNHPNCSFVDIGHDTEIWFDLVSLFNGISTFVGYLMPKLILVEEQ